MRDGHGVQLHGSLECRGKCTDCSVPPRTRAVPSLAACVHESVEQPRMCAHLVRAPLATCKPADQAICRDAVLHERLPAPT